MAKKIAMIIAFRDFRDEEYFIPKAIFESAGKKVFTFSSSSGSAIGSQGGEAKIDGVLESLKPADFEATIFVGGSGAQKYLDNPACRKIAKESAENNKVLGAICIAPAILAKAKVLENKKATVWYSPMDKSAIKILKENGAIFCAEGVVVDGKIVTAAGPVFARKFAETIIGLLK